MSFQLSSNASAATEYLNEYDPHDSYYDDLAEAGVEVVDLESGEPEALGPDDPSGAELAIHRSTRPELPPPPQDTEAQARLRACLEEALQYYRGNLQSAGPQASAVTYLQGRAIAKPTADRFEMGWAPQGWTALRDHLRAKGFSLEEQKATGLIKEGGRSGHYDRMRDRLILPLRDPWGRLTGFAGRALSAEGIPKYLNPPATELYDKSHQLYGLDQAQKAIAETGVAILAEGYLDVTRLHEHGFESAVAACGTAFGQGQLDLLLSSGAELVVSIFDGDQAGQKAAKEAAGLLIKSGVGGFTVTLPEGADPDDLLRRGGPEALDRLLAEAPTHTDFLIEATWAEVQGAGLTRQTEALQDLYGVGNSIADGPKRQAFFEQLAATTGLDFVLERMEPLGPAEPEGLGTISDPPLPELPAHLAEVPPPGTQQASAAPPAPEAPLVSAPGALAAARTAHYFRVGDPTDHLFGTAIRHPSKEWVGQGAEMLGIAGAANMDDFELLHQGLAPQKTPDEAIGRAPRSGDGDLRRLLPDKAYKTKQVEQPDGTVRQVSMRRGCEDIPFAPPKGVSVLAYHCRDHRLADLHVRAVKKVVGYYERNLTVYRKTEAGVTTPRRSDNLTVLLRHHSLSRDEDPQMHTHVQFMNLTKTPDGWRSRVNDSTFRYIGFLNALYQSEMAKGVRELGYEIRHRPQGKWEIAGLPDDLLEKFSQRSADIKDELPRLRKEYPHASGRELRQIATLYTRRDKAKKSPELKVLRERWQETYPREAILNRALSGQAPTPNGPETADELLSMAARHLSASESAFPQEDLLAQALTLSKGRFVVDDLERALDRLIDRGELVQREQPGPHEQPVWDRLATREIYDLERRVEAAVVRGQAGVSPLVRREEVEAGLLGSRLSKGQQEAVRMLLLSTNRYGLIQGDAGTGKTTAVAKVREILEEKRTFVPIRGLGFTGRAAAELSEASGVPGSTIDAFLRVPVERLPRRALLVVDESSMVSSRHLAALIERAEATDSRLHFVGDGKQLAAIGAGRLFLDLQERGATGRVHMSQVFRQQTPHLQEVVGKIKSFAEGRNRAGIEQAFKVLQQERGLLEDKSEGLIEKVADAFTERFGKVDVFAVANTNLDRQKLNEAIRNRLVASGRVDKNGTQVKVLFPIPLSGIERFEAESYQVGDKVILSKDIGPFEAGHELKVTALHPERREISLDGTPLSLTEHQEAISLYREPELTFAKGDELVFLRNDGALGVQNGSTARVKQIGFQSLTLQMGERVFEVDLRQYRYLDHGYCSTVHKAQGRTCDSVLVLSKTDQKEMNHAAAFYTAMTRARHEAVLFTDDAQVLRRQLSMMVSKTTTLHFPDLAPQPDLPEPLFQPGEPEAPAERSPQAEHLLRNLEAMSRTGAVSGKKGLFARTRALSQQPFGGSILPGALAALKRDGKVLEFQGGRLVLAEIYRAERSVRDRFEAGQGALEPVWTGGEGLLAAKDRFRLIETTGAAHVELLRQTGEALVPPGAPYRPQELAWLSRSKARGSQLEAETGLRSYSWQAVLSGSQRPPTGTWLAVENAQRLTWREWDRLTVKAKELDLRIAFIGNRADDRGAGGLFGALVETFPEAHHRLESSAPTSADLNARMHRALAGFLDQTDRGGVRRSFKALSEAGALHEGMETGQFARKLASALMVAFDRSEREAVNTAVREALKEQGQLGEERTLFLERQVPLSLGEAFDAQSYREGDRVRVLESFGAFEEGAELRVTGAAQGRVSLDGLEVDPEQIGHRIALLRTEPVPLALGESLVLNRADGLLKLKGGERAHLEAFGAGEQEGLLHLRLEDGRSLTLDPARYPHFDYAHCLAPNQIGPGEEQPVQLWLPSERPLSPDSLLALVEQGTNLEIHTDDARRLVETLERPARLETSLDLPERDVPELSPAPTERTHLHAERPDRERMALLYAAVEHLGSAKARISRQEIFGQLQRFGAVFGQTELEAGLKALEEVGYLHGLETSSQFNAPVLARSETLGMEAEIERIFRGGREACGALMPEKEAAPHLRALPIERAAAARAVLENADRIAPLVSRSPQATEQLLKDLGLALNRGSRLFRPRNLAVLAPSRRRAEALGSATGLKWATWRSFLEGDSPESWRGVLLAVDRAERIDGPTMAKLFKRAEELDARLLLVGDPLGPEPFGPGHPFLDLVGNEALPAIGKPTEAARPLREFAEGKDRQGVRRVFDRLQEQGRLHRVEDREARFAETARLKLAEPERTLVTSDAHERAELNQAVRIAFAEAGRLGEERRVELLVPHKPERPFEGRFYLVGDAALVREAFGSFEAGQWVRVTGADRENSRTLLLDGQKVDLAEHSKDLAFYRTEARPLAVGEELRFARSDRDLEVGAGELGRLTGWGEGGRLQVELREGRQVEVNPAAYPHLETAWCLAAHQLEGNGPLLVHAPAEAPADIRTLHGLTEQAQGDLRLVSDHLPRLVERFERLPEARETEPPETLQPVDHEALRQLTGQPEPQAPEPKPDQPDHSAMLEAASRHLEAHQAAFSKTELFRQTDRLAGHRLDRPDLERSLGNLVERGRLLDFGGDPHRPSLTTPELYRLERETLDRIEAGKGTCQPLVAPHRAEVWFEKTGIEGEQRRAVELSVQSPDRFVFLRAESGADRREAFRKSAELLERRFFWKKIFDPRELRALTLSGDGAQELARSTGRPAETLAGFLAKDQARLPKGAIYLVDEASLLDSRTMARLVERIEASGSRAVFVGDGHRLAAVGAGAPFREMMEQSGAERAELGVIDERAPAELAQWRRGLEAYQKGEDPEGLRRMLDSLHRESRLTQDPDRQALLERLARDWAESKDRPLVLSPTGKDRRDVTEAIRAELHRRSQLGDPVKVKARKPLQLPPLERYRAESYRPGDQVVVRQAFEGFKAREELRVEATDLENDRLLAGGKEIDLVRDLNKISVHREESLELAAGDRVRFLAGDRGLGVKTGATGELLALSEHRAHVKLDDGTKLRFDPGKHPLMEPGYADSPHRRASSEADKVMLFLNSQRGPANRPEVLAMALDTAKQDFKLYADHPDLLTEQLEKAQQKAGTLHLDDSLNPFEPGSLADLFAQADRQTHTPLQDPAHDLQHNGGAPELGHEIGGDFGVGG